jgi:aspartokinase-like uncharacterized kinase
LSEPRPTVVKVGGSLAASPPELRSLCRALADAGERHPLLVVPGGGRFADAVREHDARFSLRPQAAHAMAVLAMDQFGYALGDLIGGARLTRDTRAGAPVAPGPVRILLPAELVLAHDPLPNSWQVTSDSIAAWVAGLAGARRLVLLKSVDGLFADDAGQDGEPIPHVSVAELAALHAAGLASGVDPHLPAALPPGVEAWVIRGTAERVLELLDGGRTRGTLVTGAPASARR